MSTGFEKPGYDQEISPDRKLLGLLEERRQRSDVLRNRAEKLAEEMQKMTFILNGVEETLRQKTLSAEEREELERLSDRYAEVLTGLEDDFQTLSRNAHAAIDAVEEILNLDASFTSRGGQA